MSRRILFGSILWLSLMVNIVLCMGDSAPEKKSADLVGDIDSLIQALKAGKPAKAINTSFVNMFGMVQTTENFLEIKDIKGGQCTLYLRIEKNDLKLSDAMRKKMKEDGASLTEIDEKEQNASERAKSIEGRYGTAVFKTSELIPILEKWKMGKFSTRDWKAAEQKSGPMFE